MNILYDLHERQVKKCSWEGKVNFYSAQWKLMFRRRRGGAKDVQTPCQALIPNGIATGATGKDANTKLQKAIAQSSGGKQVKHCKAKLSIC